jgi:hypothetical protein
VNADTEPSGGGLRGGGVPGRGARPATGLVAGAVLTTCCALAASNGRPDDLTFRPAEVAATRLDVADLLGRVPSWVTLLAISVTGVLLLLVVLPLLVLALRALWQLLLRLLSSARRPVAPTARRRSRHRDPLPARDGPGGGPVELDGAARLRSAVAGPVMQAAARLQTGEDRDAGQEIIRCWEAVERAVVASGAPRRPGDTPAEVAEAVLRSFRVEAEPLATLLKVYRRVRFSRHPLDPADLTRARAAFDLVARQLGASASTPTAGG